MESTSSKGTLGNQEKLFAKILDHQTALCQIALHQRVLHWMSTFGDSLTERDAHWSYMQTMRNNSFNSGWYL